MKILLSCINLFFDSISMDWQMNEWTDYDKMDGSLKPAEWSMDGQRFTNTTRNSHFSQGWKERLNMKS